VPRADSSASIGSGTTPLRASVSESGVDGGSTARQTRRSSCDGHCRRRGERRGSGARPTLPLSQRTGAMSDSTSHGVAPESQPWSSRLSTDSGVMADECSCSGCSDGDSAASSDDDDGADVRARVQAVVPSAATGARPATAPSGPQPPFPNFVTEVSRRSATSLAAVALRKLVSAHALRVSETVAVAWIAFVVTFSSVVMARTTLMRSRLHSCASGSGTTTTTRRAAVMTTKPALSAVVRPLRLRLQLR
jgi:hypothetical protein